MKAASRNVKMLDGRDISNVDPTPEELGIDYAVAATKRNMFR